MGPISYKRRVAVNETMIATAEKILLVNSDPQTTSLLVSSIRSHRDWQHSLIETSDSLKKTLLELSVSQFQVILVHCPSFKDSPLEMLIQIRGKNKYTPLILINRPGQEKTAIHCLKHGADYYVTKETKWEIELPSIMNTVILESQQKNKTRNKIHRLEEENKSLREKSAVDEATLFYSPQHFEAVISRELKRASRHGTSLSCLILDLQNHLPKSADTDLMSTMHEQLGLLLRSVVRASDIWARLSDDRFAAILPHTSAQEARNAARRIDSEIAGLKFDWVNKKIPLKTRWGLADYVKGKIKDEKEFLGQAIASLPAR